jgi:hypothetical protein
MVEEFDSPSIHFISIKYSTRWDSPIKKEFEPVREYILHIIVIRYGRRIFEIVQFNCN